MQQADFNPAQFGHGVQYVFSYAMTPLGKRRKLNIALMPNHGYTSEKSSGKN
jgi:hypothetical protein